MRFAERDVNIPSLSTFQLKHICFYTHICGEIFKLFSFDSKSICLFYIGTADSAIEKKKKKKQTIYKPGNVVPDVFFFFFVFKKKTIIFSIFHSVLFFIPYMVVHWAYVKVNIGTSNQFSKLTIRYVCAFVVVVVIFVNWTHTNCKVRLGIFKKKKKAFPCDRQFGNMQKVVKKITSKRTNERKKKWFPLNTIQMIQFNRKSICK